MLAFNRARLQPYTPAALPALLTFVGQLNAATELCTPLHPGDVGHFLSNGLRGRDAGEQIVLYEDEGSLHAILFDYAPKEPSIQVLLLPHLRDTAFEAAAWDWLIAQATARLTSAEPATTTLQCEAMSCDPRMHTLLETRGFIPAQEPSYQVTLRTLADIPSPQLPTGFSIRPVQGSDEADAVGDLHASAFGSRWPAGEYAQVMATPGFDHTRELLVVAPDGQLAAFTIYWLDPISRCGLFEPVGCRPTFQRQGLTRALLYEGMLRMREAGMQWAKVVHLPAPHKRSPADFYAAVGFTPFATLDSYTLPHSPFVHIAQKKVFRRY